MIEPSESSLTATSEALRYLLARCCGDSDEHAAADSPETRKEGINEPKKSSQWIGTFGGEADGRHLIESGLRHCWPSPGWIFEAEGGQRLICYSVRVDSKGQIALLT